MSRHPATLLDAFRSGAPDAAEELAARALRLALRTSAGLLHDKGQAEDVAQEVTVEVLRGVSGLRDPDALDAWIQRIAVRRSIRALRKTRSRGKQEVPLTELTRDVEATADRSPHDEAEARSVAATVRAAVELLPPKQRAAIILRYVHDYSQKQIADALDVRLGTAGALLSRARTTLRGTGALGDLIGNDSRTAL